METTRKKNDYEYSSEKPVKEFLLFLVSPYERTKSDCSSIRQTDTHRLKWRSLKFHQLTQIPEKRRAKQIHSL